MRNLIICLAVTLVPLTGNMAFADAGFDDWQREKLLQPTDRDLAREGAGRVHIFDGLKDSDIELAMQTQFDRLASMMFVRTVVTDETGAPMRDGATGESVDEDDDCD